MILLYRHLKQKLFTALFIVIHVSYMVAIVLPCFTQDKEVSCLVFEQEETESQGDYEYLGLIGYMMNSQDLSSFNSVLHNTSFFEYSISINDLKHSKPETPPPNC